MICTSFKVNLADISSIFFVININFIGYITGQGVERGGVLASEDVDERNRATELLCSYFW